MPFEFIVRNVHFTGHKVRLFMGEIFLSVQLLCVYLIMTVVILPQAEIWLVYPR